MRNDKKNVTALDDDALESVAGGFGEGGVIASGSFSSYTGTSLNIIVNWYAAVNMYGCPELMVVVCSSSGEVEGTLILKAEARNRMLRLFFVLSDGRKILTPVFWWQRSAGFYDLEVGARYRLRYVPGKDGYAKLGSATLEGE